MGAWILLAILIAVIAAWWDATTAKDKAREAALRACQLSQTRILDDAVALRKWWLRRNPQGHVELCRLYFFDFTVYGEERFHAYVLMFGHRVARVSLDIEDALED